MALFKRIHSVRLDLMQSYFITFEGKYVFDKHLEASKLILFFFVSLRTLGKKIDHNFFHLLLKEKKNLKPYIYIAVLEIAFDVEKK